MSDEIRCHGATCNDSTEFHGLILEHNLGAVAVFLQTFFSVILVPGLSTTFSLFVCFCFNFLITCVSDNDSYSKNQEEAVSQCPAEYRRASPETCDTRLSQNCVPNVSLNK